MSGVQPLVSIIIPVYNGANYMRKAIDSALAQTYPNIEVVVVNDGSIDDGKTEEIALSYGDRIRYISKANGGVSSALNCGIKAMKGEYFSWLSHDDVYAPQKIEVQIQSLQKYSDDKIVSVCLTDTIDAQSHIIKSASFRHASGLICWEEATMYITQNGANGCSLLIPKAAFDDAGLFDEQMRYCQDILMWWKICLAGYGLDFCNELGVHYRVHGKQLTQTGAALYHKEARLIGQEMIPRFCEASDKKDNILYEYAKKEAIHGNSQNVDDCIKSAKDKQLFSWIQAMKLHLLCVYGKVRPFIRCMYYSIFRKIKTE